MDVFSKKSVLQVDLMDFLVLSCLVQKVLLCDYPSLKVMFCKVLFCEVYFVLFLFYYFIPVLLFVRELVAYKMKNKKP